MRYIVHLFFLLLSLMSEANNYDIRILSNKDGLSNSSVNVVFQDSSKLMWFGTWDGLNMYNGKEFRVYKPSTGNAESISNNIIRDIIEEKKDILWIATDFGINRLHIRENRFERFFVDSLHREVTNEHSYLIAGNRSGRIIASVYQQGIYFFHSLNNRFEPLDIDEKLNIRKIIIDDKDQLWILTREKSLFKIALRQHEDQLIVGDIDQFTLLSSIENVFLSSSGNPVFQTTDETIYLYDEKNKDLKKISVNEEIGSLNDLGFLDESIYLATSKGLYHYHPVSGMQGVISNSPVLDIQVGSQDIIWAGTDMKGVYKIVPFNELFKTYSLESYQQFQHFGSGAVRTFVEDEHQSLWVGTKGAGIVNFTQNRETNELEYRDWYSTDDGLLSNSVFEIVEGNRNELWIGTDGEGINYYDKKAKRIYSLDFPGNMILSSVYAILPDNDDVLWVGTSGYGMYKLEIDYSTQPYSVIDYSQFVFTEGESSLSNNIVYSIIKDGGNHLWIGTRGGGVNRFNKNSRNFEVFKLSGDNPNFYGNDDVLCLFDDHKGNLWAGTSMGLNRLTWKSGQKPVIVHFNEQDGMPNNTIHGILMDAKDNLWVSTNNGLAKLIPENNRYRIISYFTDDGLHDNEFSDGAYYASSVSSDFYFGGISGFSRFNPLEIIQSEYMPELWLDAFYLDNIQTNLSGYIVRKKNREVLTLSHKNNSFGFSFIPIDYLTSNKCEIAYKLEGFHNEWVNIGTSNAVMFANIPKGEYLLKIKSSNANKIWGETIFTLPVQITPPWWNSNMAYLFYTILFLVLLFLVREIILYRLKVSSDLRMKELEKQKIEEIHQGKLSFFTNIAHEFSNSLTLIYGPCDKLIKENRNNNITRKYLQVIKSNSERMQHLIEQLVEFRKAETGHLQLKVETVDVPELIKYAIDNFLEILEQKKITYAIISSPENICWQTDRDSLEKIIFNLLSNAVKFTPEEHHIGITISVAGNKLCIEVRNSGVGIKPDCFDRLFDKFEVLNQFEKQLSFGNYPRHGIGLALCKSIVQVMHGDIRVDSDGVSFTSFAVDLPELTLTAMAEDASSREKDSIQYPTGNCVHVELFHEAHTLQEDIVHQGDAFILVVEDDVEIRLMIKELLGSGYAILEASNGSEALEIISKQRPILVISDIIMPVMDGVEFVKRMKGSDFTRHIPIILLSSRNSIESQIEGFETGADAYISKPFNFRHLEVLVKSLLKKKTVLEDYNNSPYFALEQYEGALVHKEDKDLLISILNVIYDNLNNEDLSIELLASETAISNIQLYRKIKQVTGKTPTEFIRSIRLKHAGKLLRTTNKNVKEIMYSSGFSNKAYFYREFLKKYSKTPMEYRESGTDEGSIKA